MSLSRLFVLTFLTSNGLKADTRSTSKMTYEGILLMLRQICQARCTKLKDRWRQTECHISDRIPECQIIYPRIPETMSDLVFGAARRFVFLCSAQGPFFDYVYIPWAKLAVVTMPKFRWAKPEPWCGWFSMVQATSSQLPQLGFKFLDLIWFDNDLVLFCCVRTVKNHEFISCGHEPEVFPSTCWTRGRLANLLRCDQLSSFLL